MIVEGRIVGDVGVVVTTSVCCTRCRARVLFPANDGHAPVHAFSGTIEPGANESGQRPS